MVKKSAVPIARLLDDDQIGMEARAGDADHQALKVWLRLLACTTQIETEIRRRLRKEFGMTLARFDYLAQLHRHPEGLRMSALSRYLMVTGGNVTALTDDLEGEGLVLRETDAEDRRSFKVALTPAGRKAFEKVAQVHEGWVVELLAGLGVDQKHELHELLGTLRVHLSHAEQDGPQAGARRPPPPEGGKKARGGPSLP
ncbi:MarR family winged helix-turn-helix transcriptional regulator [Ideonella sp.]|uniref:MarR family winged helix-turn-helix transcriptional regulator n=1 Tax=Ideonella sp. TaxID=1929293 RepID=UPI0035AE45A1